MKPYRILVVEDESIAALSLKENLENFGYEVTGIAASKEEALKEIEEELPDLVLLDINLDEKEAGIEVGRQLLKEKDLPVIFLTAYADKETISKAREALPYGYIVKPYVENELWAAIEMAIHKHTADKRQRELHLLKDKFYSIVAHDLKSPLAALTLTTRLLVRKADELSREELKDFISEIHDTARNLSDFTENLLTWSRSQSGNIKSQTENVCVGELIREVFSLLHAQAKHKSIRLIKSVREEKVLADRNMLRSVVLNLVQNGLKFTRSGGQVKVEVRQEGEFVELTVQDNGIGMTGEQLRNLFDFKHTRHTAGTQEEKGTGLGLLLCKEFVEAAGGAIQVHSSSGKGTEVRVSLPAAVKAKLIPSAAEGPAG